ALGTLVIEGDVAARDRRAEHSAGVRDPAAGLPELVEHGGALRVAEVQAIGDAEGARTRACDVARRFRHTRLPALVGIEQHIPAVAVDAHRDGEICPPPPPPPPAPGDPRGPPPPAHPPSPPGRIVFPLHPPPVVGRGGG